MRSMILVAALMMGSIAMAEGTTAPAAPAQPAAAAAAAPAAPVAKMDKKAARAECKKENKDLKGKALAECVKSKTM